ncbi:ShlB/FhaC/HecB family hemolysin secretion/activation protein [Anabaenopsis tanganyikae CS-531]|uniref:ShlB/FhaC/HecB family hemolysin secretion/activation protein n=3 Tax=Nodulariaceae TaxID=3079761 RepID=A0ABT6KG01_9CYAN|nr:MULTISPECIES: ShlB/FhaC/HecB family hemolysin secretion/activation protein [Anabaenopsis]MDB9538713.1 ShlB/FhaC/HecB family hemolysin secretion/activation protein [Anabaenopsis arnoldii]MDH6090987.1 ShlB/FhaC/HecB family hemolysin secretion/activation protein [Anabaenopsis arnoldii]MDH6106688.1 ShlB/FhaC/HecB family hemolysin secretion/activation protein [Anabaenopsis tanganyikae CS-531]
MMYQCRKKLKMSWYILSIFVLINSINNHPSLAQTVENTQISNGNFSRSQQLPPPQDIQPPAPSPLETPQPLQPLPPPAELLPPSFPDTQSQPPTLEDVPQTITVQKFDVVGSTVFSPEELAKVTAEFTNRPITLTELFQARDQITELYLNQGYITSGAYIPPQAINSGVIKIQVLEGKLEDIQISGTRRLNPNYVRSRLALATSAPLNRDKLLEALQLLQLNPLIENLSAELSAGLSPGTNLLEVQVREAKSFSSEVALDNGRSPSVGSFRRRLQLKEANLLGVGDSLSLAYANNDGSNSFDSSYTLPLNPRNATISFNFGTSSSNVIEEPFNILDIQSSSGYYEVTVRQPLIQTQGGELALGLTASRRESEATYIEGERLPFPSLGADDQGRTRISALRFFQEWTTRNSRQVIAVRSQFNLGIGAFNATINSDAPDSRFFSWQGQAQWARLLAPETLLIVRANTQIASISLLPLEQFGIGGIDSVRGYRQDFLLADNGAVVGAEVQIPVVRLSQSRGVLQVIPFIDFGVGWNNSGRNPDSNTLAAVGLGWRWSQGDRFTARLDWGIPLVSVDSPDRTWQENGLYFSVFYHPF